MAARPEYHRSLEQQSAGAASSVAQIISFSCLARAFPRLIRRCGCLGPEVATGARPCRAREGPRRPASLRSSKPTAMANQPSRNFEFWRGLKQLRQELADFVEEYDSRGAQKWSAEVRGLELKASADMVEDDFVTALSEEGMMRNRYVDVLAREDTRVRLQGDREQRPSRECDYINANYVELDGGAEREYIAAQAPTNNTVVDFWDMVWQTHSRVIVMLTNFVEQRVEKCTPYFPEHVGSTCTFDRYAVRRLSKQRLLLSMRPSSAPSSMDAREICHFRLLSWPDHGVPQSADDLLQLVDEVNAARRELNDRLEGGGVPPIVVHCSAGIGRSGTFIAVHALWRYLDRQVSHLSLPEIRLSNYVRELVLAMKRQRGGMVQSGAQYRFVHIALLEMLARLHIDREIDADG